MCWLGNYKHRSRDPTSSLTVDLKPDGYRLGLFTSSECLVSHLITSQNVGMNYRKLLYVRSARYVNGIPFGSWFRVKG